MTKSVLVMNLRDRHYPRHERLQSFFRRSSYTVDIIASPIVSGPRIMRPAVRAVKLFRSASSLRTRYDVVLLAEFSLQYAFVSWVISKLKGSVHVVDGFVGLYETHVEDRADYARYSLIARVMNRLDLLAYRLADIYLIDTDVRGQEIKQRFGEGPLVLTLPVGAPSWVRVIRPSVQATDELRVLYYGNYVPLHGVDTLVQAVALARACMSISLTLVGDGQMRRQVEAQVTHLGIGDVCRFQDAVPPQQLLELMGSHHVTVGVFGSSRKASGVIANKTWQALSAGTQVVTRSSEALNEILVLVPNQLVQVPSADPTSLAMYFGLMGRRLQQEKFPYPDARAKQRLEKYVNCRYEGLGRALDACLLP